MYTINNNISAIKYKTTLENNNKMDTLIKEKNRKIQNRECFKFTT